MKTNFAINKRLLTVMVCVSAFFAANAQTVKLVQKWDTGPALKVPESVIYDPQTKSIYVANINGKPDEKDGNGFIVKLSTSGKVETLEWAKGLDAPKGMGIFGGKLYVTDITRIAVIDIASAKVEKYIDVPGSVFLNDITIDKKGKVFFTDSSDKKIYTLNGDKAELWLNDPTLQKPNGLHAEDNVLKVIDMGGGDFYNISYTDKKLTSIAKGIPSGDGIVEIGKGEYLISNWNGEINYVKDGKVEKLLDTKEQKVSAADIWYIPSEKLLLIPTFFTNSVVAYSVVK